MRDLLPVLRDEDQLHWMAVARAWGVDLSTTGHDPLGHLVHAMLDADRVRAQFEALAAAPQSGLTRIRDAGGRLPIMRFAREFGEIREMGVARREREMPWLDPISPAEALWYGGWLGRGFAISHGGPEEFVFIPGDLLALIPAATLPARSGVKFDAYVPGAKEVSTALGTALAEDACTLLAFVRANPQASAYPETWRRREVLARQVLIAPALPMLVHLLREMGVLRSDSLRLEPQSAAAFLGLSAHDSQLRLISTWREAAGWNELAEWGEVGTRGSHWPNDPLLARNNLVGLLREVPAGAWVRLESFLRVLRDEMPEFMRPAAALEAWALTDRRTGTDLRGWDSWEKVEGRFARWYLGGPLSWLGLIELAGGQPPQAFRASSIAATALGLAPASSSPAASSRQPSVRLRSDGTLTAPEGSDLTLRYQLARCLSWVGRQGRAYVYRLDPPGLETARRQGLELRHVMAALERATGRPIPPALVKALEDWQRHGSRVIARPLRVMQFKDAETARLAARLKGMSAIPHETLGPQAWVVRPEDLGRVRLLLAESGLLLDVEAE